MAYHKIGGKLTKLGIEKINSMLESAGVCNYHKSLLRAILDRGTKKNMSKTDGEILNTIIEAVG